MDAVGKPSLYVETLVWSVGFIRDSSITSVYLGNSAPNGAKSGFRNWFDPKGLLINFFVYKLPSSIIL